MANNFYIDLPVEGGGGGGGTVTSVAFTADPSSVFDVSGSPVTTSGIIALSMDNQSANTVLSGPTTGSAAAPAFRALVAADIPATLGATNFTGAVTFGNYGISPSEFDNGNSGTSLTVNLASGSAQRIKATGNCSITITNPVTGGSYVLKIVNDGTVRTFTWPGTVLWSGGSAPTFTGTNNKVDLINLYWDGSSYYGSFSLNY